jgi:hypothetical protein
MESTDKMGSDAVIDFVNATKTVAYPTRVGEPITIVGSVGFEPTSSSAPGWHPKPS